MNTEGFNTPDERDKKFEQIDETTDNEKNRTANDNIENNEQEDENPLSTSGAQNEHQDYLGGSTNLSLDQLKQGDENNE